MGKKRCCCLRRQQTDIGGSSEFIQVESARAGMRGAIRQDAEKKRRGADTVRRKRRPEGQSGLVWTSGEHHVVSGHKERCNASQDTQDA